MNNKIKEIGKLIGNTPLIQLDNNDFNLFAKLESFNFTGSIKDRAVNNILNEAIRTNKINENSTIIESSSGNFAYSTALHCKKLGLDFVCVIDSNINSLNLKKLEVLASEIILIDERDETGGYLLNRIRKVKEVLSLNPNYYWTNQYGNINNYEAYKQLAIEITSSIEDLDYIFVATSSTGTIKGLSKYLKKWYQNIKIIGVDVKGSMIFSDQKKKRNISGIGSSKKSEFLVQNDVDDVILLNEDEILDGCQRLLKDHALFLGGSSGACYSAVLKYFTEIKGNLKDKNVLIICPDDGVSYIDSIYSKQ